MLPDFLSMDFYQVLGMNNEEAQLCAGNSTQADVIQGENQHGVMPQLDGIQKEGMQETYARAEEIRNVEKNGVETGLDAEQRSMLDGSEISQQFLDIMNNMN